MRITTLALPLLVATSAFSAPANEIFTAQTAFTLANIVPDEQLAIEEFGIPTAGSSVRIQLRGGPALATSALAFRFSDLDSLVEPWGADDSFVRWTQTDAYGFSSAQLPIPVDMRPGQLVDFQWLSVDPESGQMMRSEVMRMQVLGEDMPLYTDYPVNVELELSGARGASGTARLSGSFRVKITPGESSDDLLAEVTSMDLVGESILLRNGERTGDMSLRLEEAFFAPLHYTSGMSFAENVNLLLFAPIFQPKKFTLSESNPTPLQVQGILGATKVDSGGSFSFAAAAPTGQEQLTTIINVDGDFDLDANYCLAGDTFKRVVELKITIVRDDDGMNASWTQDQVDAAIAGANAVWCEQCCVRFDQVGEICFLDETDYLNMGWRDRQTNHRNSQGNDVVDVIFTDNIPGGSVGSTVDPGGGDPTVFVGGDSPDGPRTTAHELGHVFGMGHWDDSGNIMHPTDGSTGSCVNKRQCDFAFGSNKVKWDSEICVPSPGC